MTSGGLPPNKQNLKHLDHRREQPLPPRSLIRQTIQKFIEGGLIVNGKDVSTPTALRKRSHISAPHIAPSAPHARHHHQPSRHNLHFTRTTHQRRHLQPPKNVHARHRTSPPARHHPLPPPLHITTLSPPPQPHLVATTTSASPHCHQHLSPHLLKPDLGQIHHHTTMNHPTPH